MGHESFGRSVSLTFDDGPHPVYTPKILKALRDYGVKAVFFVNGNKVKQHPEILKQIVAEGHTLGNHTWDHPKNLHKMSASRIHKQLADTQAAVDKALGYHYEMELMRPPYGNLNNRTKAEIHKFGDAVIKWNVDSNDWDHKLSERTVMNNVFKGRYGVNAGGGVILFHDVHARTARIMPKVLERLANEGYEITTTEELLERRKARNAAA